MERGTRMEDNRTTFESFKVLVQNEPLIETAPSIASIDQGLFTMKDAAIYYGTGLCTPTHLSLGLPFDVLSMVLVAERLRRTAGLTEIYHHIADTHAKTNKQFAPEEIDEIAQRTKESLERVASNFQLDHLHIVLASEFDQGEQFINIYNQIKTDKHEYVRREMADMEWYRQQHNVYLKLGWIIQASETGLGFDERLFDREYKEVINQPLSFVYLKPGRTLDKHRPKASPYIHIEGENRLLLRKGEDVRGKLARALEHFGDRHLGGVRGYYSDIIRVYERLFGSLGNIPFEEKIETIIDKATR